MSIQFLPLPAIAYPQNAMINFQPMNQALQFYANNQLERGRFGLQQNADVREQEMHPLRMNRENATTAGLLGTERRAETRFPEDMRHLRAQTGLLGAQTGLTGFQAAAARDANSRANQLHEPALATANVNAAGVRLDQDQRIAALLQMAQTPQAHDMAVRTLRMRGFTIPQGLDTWQGVQNGGSAVAGPALTHAQTQIAQLNRLDPRRVTQDLMGAAASVGWDVNSPRGPTPGQTFALTGQVPAPQQMQPAVMQLVDAADNAVVAGNDAIGMLNRALDLSVQAYSGMGAPARGALADSLGMARGGATVQMDTLLGRQAVGQLRTLFGANPTEGERAILMQLEGSSSMSPRTRETLINESIAAARQRIAFNTMRAMAMRRGEYFAPAFNPQANYAAMLAATQQGGQGGGQGGGAPPPAQGAPQAPPQAGPSGGGRDHGSLTRDNLRSMTTRMNAGDTFMLDGRRWRVNGPNSFSQVQ